MSERVEIGEATGSPVERLPRRVAHAVHALMEVRNDVNVGPYGPFKASEIVVYDGEALSARSTAAALREAQKLGFALYVGRGLWTAANAALDQRAAFEARYLRETDAAFDTATSPKTPPSSVARSDDAGGGG